MNEDDVAKPREGRDPQVRVVDRRWWAREDTDAAADDQAVGRKPTYVEDLERQLADARNHLQELTTAHRRSIDEFEQMKLRIRREVGRDVERTRRALLADLLDVVDNLDRAVAASQSEDAGGPAALDSLVRGMELVRSQFLGKLTGFGVTRMPALGEPFDASRHEAVTTTLVGDPAQSGVVVAVIREGYAIGDDILRPASVVVGRHEPGDEAA
jgi:molecular chaperone GrpE